MYTKILLAVDLNHDSSWKTALPTAMEMARGGGGPLHLLAIAPDFKMALVGSYFSKDFERDALKHLYAELEKFAATHVDKDLNVEIHIAQGAIASEVVRVAQEHSVDLIVMASHPPDEMREFLVGSNADRVVRHSPISVLVVRG
ncbi:universal stress protein [Roseitalea porphyridii]|uniref:universal stress protein n=1 Tax=Roseitalea porphyridii TaxID=1852022 RepID=UPI0032EF4CEC